MLVVDDRVLTLLHQKLNEIAKVGAELFPELARSHQRIFSRFFLEFLKRKYKIRVEIYQALRDFSLSFTLSVKFL